MREWRISVDQAMVSDLEHCFLCGPLVDDAGTRQLEEEQFAAIGGLKVDIFSNEHPPPHFRVSFQGETNNFTISDCTPLNGSALSRFFRNIKKWHKENKAGLIDFWNSKRPSDCPVGAYKEPNQ